jgi:hypothetical protein
LVLEDIQEYSTLVRIFTELGVQQDYLKTSGTILDGMYTDPTDGVFMTGNNSSTTTKQYCLNLMSGLLSCKKLIPLKWMAAQFAIELTLGSNDEVLISNTDGTGANLNATYGIDFVNFIAEMMEFDSTYDAAFYAGLSNGGVPLKFESWHFHTFPITSNTISAQIHERSRSIKAGFAVIRETRVAKNRDTFIFLNALGAQTTATAQTTSANEGGAADATPPPDESSVVREYQWRVGGKYYPSQPVNCFFGGAEAMVDLLKTVNALGDYRTASNMNYLNFAPRDGVGSRFIISQEFENTDVSPDSIAGINGEEQSDINLTVKALSASGLSNGGGKKLDVFMLYDALLIVRDGNVVDLVM